MMQAVQIKEEHLEGKERLESAEEAQKAIG